MLSDMNPARALFTVDSNVYVHKDSGLGHIMSDEMGIRFACGKILTSSYRVASAMSYQVHMCLRCKPAQ